MQKTIAGSVVLQSIYLMTRNPQLLMTQRLIVKYVLQDRGMTRQVNNVVKPAWPELILMMKGRLSVYMTQQTIAKFVVSCLSTNTVLSTVLTETLNL